MIKASEGIENNFSFFERVWELERFNGEHQSWRVCGRNLVSIGELDPKRTLYETNPQLLGRNWRSL
jgi:hypothetical protein